MNNFKKNMIYEDKVSSFKKKCKCGHIVIFSNNYKKDYLICRWCGRRIYKDKKVEFRDKLKKLMEE